jgi:hypothetical protein
MLSPVLVRDDQLALLVEPGSQPALHGLDDKEKDAQCNRATVG